MATPPRKPPITPPASPPPPIVFPAGAELVVSNAELEVADAELEAADAELEAADAEFETEVSELEVGTLATGVEELGLGIVVFESLFASSIIFPTSGVMDGGPATKGMKRVTPGAKLSTTAVDGGRDVILLVSQPEQ
jgi:hypothetical protein